MILGTRMTSRSAAARGRRRDRRVIAVGLGERHLAHALKLCGSIGGGFRALAEVKARLRGHRDRGAFRPQAGVKAKTVGLVDKLKNEAGVL